MTGPDVPLMLPASVGIGPSEVGHLRSRIAATRRACFRHQEPWAFGTGPEVLAEVLDLWGEFDVGALADSLNAIPQVDVRFGELTIRALHLRGEVDEALPIVITHGWPSTVLEVLPLAQRLARPSQYGGAAADAFHVVVPALPGFPLSGAALELSEYTGAGIADRWAQLMSALGYDRFAASGGDIGARVAVWLAARHPERVIGAHVTSNVLWPELPGVELGPGEREYVGRLAAWERDEGAYMHIQETKPLSLAHGLSDSPAGLAAWIVEKWHTWSGSRDDLLDRFAPELLGHLTLYWMTNSIATSFLPYHVAHRPPGKRPWGLDITVPVSFYLPPDDIGGIPPREFVARQYRIAGWTEFPRGGHFMASEYPDLLAADVRKAFRDSLSPPR
jgi:pimeloyl-ACP methyl ester carboxylesterase